MATMRSNPSPLTRTTPAFGGDDSADGFREFKELGRGVLKHVGQSGLSIWAFERKTGSEAWDVCLARPLVGVDKFDERA